MKFTQRTIERLSLEPGQSKAMFWDGDAPGLGVRIQGKAKTWVCRYRVRGKIGTGSQRQITLGRVVSLSLASARGLAGEYKRDAALGVDRHADLERQAKERQAELDRANQQRIGAMIDGYLWYAELVTRPSTFRNTKRYLCDVWKPLHNESAADLTRTAIIARLERIAQERGGVTANRAKSALSHLFAWALSRGMIQANPMVGVPSIRQERARDRVLDTDELRAVMADAVQNDGDYSQVIRLLVLTGQRRGEVAGMRWGELDLDKALWSIPASRCKNGKAHEVPLSRQAVELLRGVAVRPGIATVFGSSKDGYTGFVRGKKSADARLAGQIKSPYVLHDLRRSCVTGMAGLGARPDVIELTVNHVSGARGSVAGVYNRAELLGERRQALQAWADHLDGTTRIVETESQAVLAFAA